MCFQSDETLFPSDTFFWRLFHFDRLSQIIIILRYVCKVRHLFKTMHLNRKYSNDAVWSEMNVQDSTLHCWLITILILSLSLALRYIHALYLGAQSRWHSDGPRRHFHWRLMFESADITMLRLLEAFLKSAPQLVLQLSIMIHGNDVLPLQGERDDWLMR